MNTNKCAVFDNNRVDSGDKCVSLIGAMDETIHFRAEG
jgi:hypothetical protein